MSESPVADGRAGRSKSAFRQECRVAININAPAGRIWALLTDAAGFPRWNSTVQQIEGAIALGQTIRLCATIAPQRTFKLTVSEFVPDRRMVWRDGRAPMFTGVRTYTLSPRPDGSTDFAMAEVFSGVMLPLIARSLPDFGPSFEQYAADLKREAERSG